MNAKDWLFVALGAVGVVYLTVFIRGVLAARRTRAVAHGVGPDGAVAPSMLIWIEALLMHVSFTRNAIRRGRTGSVASIPPVGIVVSWVKVKPCEAVLLPATSVAEIATT